MLASLGLSPAQLSGIVRRQGRWPRQTTHTEVLHRGGGGGVGDDNLEVAVSLHQLQQKWLFESVSQEWQRRKGVLAEPSQEGRPAGAASANAYTLSLWAGGGDRTLTGRQRKRGNVSAQSPQSLRGFGIFFCSLSNMREDCHPLKIQYILRNQDVLLSLS